MPPKRAGRGVLVTCIAWPLVRGEAVGSTHSISMDDADWEVNVEDERNGTQYHGLPCPPFFGAASWWSRVTFAWTWRLLRAGLKRPLDETDLCGVPRHMRAGKHCPKMAAAWREVERANHSLSDPNALRQRGFASLFLAAVRAFGRQHLAPLMFFRACMLGLQFARPIVLQLLLLHVEELSTDGVDTTATSFIGKGAGLVVAMTVLSLLSTAATQWYWWLGVQWVRQTRTVATVTCLMHSARACFLDRR